MNTSRTTTIMMILLALCLAGAAFAGGPGNAKFDEDSFEVIEESGVATIIVERSNGEDGVVSVDYRTSGTTATPGVDYQDVVGTLTWANGDGGSKTFTIPLIDDAEAEGAESVLLTLENPTGGMGLDDERATSTLIILASDGGTGGGGGGGDDGGDDSPGDDDEPGVLKFDESSFEVIEEAGIATIRVERSQGEGGEVSVDYSTADGTATAGDDYTPVSGTLTWANGDGTTKTFVVPLIDDADPEGLETIELMLSNPTGGAGLDVERSDSLVVILASDGGTGGTGGGGDDGGGDDGGGDDGGGGGNDGPDQGTFKLGSGAFQVLEGGGTAVIVVERSQGETGEVSVDYQLMDGTATAGLDYTDVSGTITWANNDGSDKTFLIPILDDADVEGNETLDIQLLNPTGGAAIDAARGDAVLTIIDNDASGDACAGGSNSLCLLGGRFQVDIQWRDFENRTGSGRSVALSDQSGLFWFFDRANFEVLVKMVDACNGFGSNWLFFSSTTNVEMDVTVRDTQTGKTETFHNPLGQTAAPVIDISSFADCN